jgi:hypothetical protein
MFEKRDGAAGGDGVPQKLHLLHSKLTLVRVQHQPKLLQPVKNQVQVLQVFLLCGTANNDVIKVDENEVQPCQDPINQPLEPLARVLQPERHPQEFKQTKRCNHSRFRDILGHHGNLIIALPQI